MMSNVPSSSRTEVHSDEQSADYNEVKRVAEKENTTCEHMVLNSNDVSLCNPPVSQCKGRRKPHWMKPRYEMDDKKRRICSTCGKKEGHNSHTCRKKDSQNPTPNPEPEVNEEHEGDYEDEEDCESDGDCESDPEIFSDF